MQRLIAVHCCYLAEEVIFQFSLSSFSYLSQVFLQSAEIKFHSCNRPLFLMRPDPNVQDPRHLTLQQFKNCALLCSYFLNFLFCGCNGCHFLLSHFHDKSTSQNAALNCTTASQTTIHSYVPGSRKIISDITLDAASLC